MKRHVHLQTRDIEIGRRLGRCYRITTAAIEAEHYGVHEKTMGNRLNRLTESKLLNRLTVLANGADIEAGPILKWMPGDREPNFGALANMARKRWKDKAVQLTTIYTANNKLLAYLGMPTRSHIKRHQANHDLGVTAMYFYALSRWPHLSFVGEDVFAPLRGYGEGVEDAQLVDGDEIVFVLEHAGSYREERIRHFHQHVAVERNLPYLLF